MRHEQKMKKERKGKKKREGCRKNVHLFLCARIHPFHFTCAQSALQCYLLCRVVGNKK